MKGGIKYMRREAQLQVNCSDQGVVSIRRMEQSFTYSHLNPGIRFQYLSRPKAGHADQVI